MIAKLSPELVRELEQAGRQPLPLENPQTKRLYVLVDVEQYEVVPREQTSSPENWSEEKRTAPLPYDVVDVLQAAVDSEGAPSSPPT